MTDTARRIIADSLPAIVASLVVSGTGAIGGMYVGYRLVEQRVSHIEHEVERLGIRLDSDISKINNQLSRNIEKLSKIEANTEYIRGRMEGP